MCTYLSLRGNIYKVQMDLLRMVTAHLGISIRAQSTMSSKLVLKTMYMIIMSYIYVNNRKYTIVILIFK